MFQPDMYRNDDPALAAARTRASRAGKPGGRIRPGDGAEPQTAALAGWALMHGLAAPWLTGNVPIRIRSHWRAPSGPTCSRPVSAAADRNGEG